MNSANKGWPWSEVQADVPSELQRAPNLPKISIVTPSFNQGEFIEETIRSVLSQNYPRLEYIVMDGGSSDKSAEVIQKYSDRISFWVSEKDRGQSHAINKALGRCTGDIFNWINSDDLLMPGALWAVADAWIHRPGSIVSGSIEFFDQNGVSAHSKARGQTLQNFIRFWDKGEFGWGQPATFLPLNAVREAEGVREHLKYCMDYELMVRLLARETAVTYVDQTLARFRLHDTSKTVGSREAFRLERIPALRSLTGIPVKVEAWEWKWQQAIRLVDVARHAWRHGGRSRALRLLGRAFMTSPRGTVSELSSRAIKRGGAAASREHSPAI